MEGLSLYRPMPGQERFHRSAAGERLVRGSNRAGKTLCAAVDVASALTGQNVTAADGRPIPNSYPKTDGVIYATGVNSDHVAKTFFRLLFKRGAYKIIRDTGTGRWRAYDPTSAADVLRKHERRPSNPLVPKRLIKQVAFNSKAKDEVKVVKMKNGWEIWFFSAKATPPAGDPIDVAWLDEEIGEGHYVELRFRLIDKQGKLVWSATPQCGREELYAMHMRAEEQAGLPDPDVEEFFLKSLENPHLPQDELRKVADACLDEADVRVRVDGDFIYESFRVYGEFDPDMHGLDLEGGIPDDWTRYVAIDPGHTVAAVLFGAVPPPWYQLGDVQVGHMLVLYDEIYLKRATARRVAEALHKKLKGRTEQVVERWWIDNRAARQTQIASGKRVGEQYTEEFKKLGLKSRRTGSAFSFGNDSPDDGISAVRTWLELRPNGLPKLMVLRRKSTTTGRWVTACPELLGEFKKYHRQKDRRGQLLDAPVKANDHLMDDVRYLVMGNPQHVAVPAAARADSYAAAAMKDLTKRYRPGQAGPATTVFG